MEIEEFLKINSKFVKFESGEDGIKPGDYECIMWMFDKFNVDNLYCDGYHWHYFFPDGSSWSEKVSHYIPKEIDEATQEKDYRPNSSRKSSKTT
jgi:hypothetical protein